MEDTTQVSQGQATPEQTEPVAPVEATATPIDKAELKTLLEQIVADIHSNHPTHLAAKELLKEFSAAKEDFITLCQRIEDEIKKITSK